MEETKFTILNRRYEMSVYKQAVTIMASNSPPGDLGSYLSSRIQDSRHAVINLSVPDLRPAQQWENKYG